ncbi:uncharacterized protein LOC105275393 [Ooceraea biroi]|uniref:uncharacterized protein LOC105275393 n=1 Tax=Ooceraea biroi TaxID=2015173 RepID=UPI000F075291|nr:uncharacterized protein LOC105275393 [Ooceraea biroi]XP_026823590.1 uncharacterized protein LOC105275393 [Ooceraea biroi]XP_026823591.1 uncharacterized protein LOC105275393 [Ooceraea biroi]
MTGWRMQPTASVLGVIAIVSVMITNTASDAKSDDVERGVNHLDEEDRHFDERIANRTVESASWSRGNDTAALEEAIPAFAVEYMTSTKDSISLVTVMEAHLENTSKRYTDDQRMLVPKRIEASEQAEEVLTTLEHEDVRRINESTVEKSKEDWLMSMVSVEEAGVTEGKNVEDIRAISFLVPPLEKGEDYQDSRQQEKTNVEQMDETSKFGEARKNQSRPANNLLLTGKSTKAFYEIKPSIRTLETDRGREHQFQATTHRTLLGRKFVLPSVDSAFGKFGPYFEDGGQEINVTARIGSTVLLDCKIGMLGDKKVTWLQHNKESFRLLTVGRTLYSNDQRISLNFRYPSNWRLQILYANPRDSGLYQCQVATHPPMVKKVNVIVTAPALTISDDSGRIVSKERHLKAGSILRLRCEARDVLESLNESVVWTRGDETLTEDVSENRTTEISAGKEVLVIVSTLIVERASPRHAGNYSCMVPGKAKTIVAVHVLNGELPAAVHDGNGVSRAFLNLWLVHLTMSYVFTR